MVEPASLSSPAGAIVQRLEHENGAVRLLALHVLRKVEPASLSSHVGAIVQRLEDENGGVRWAALHVLRMVERTSLSSHVGAIVQRLEHENGGVRRAALDVLCIVEPASLSSHVGAIVQRLEHENGAVRLLALHVLRIVEPASLSSHVGAIVQRLEQNGGVRWAALHVLCMVERTSLSSHVGATVQRLEHENGGVRRAALDVLCIVEPASLSSHVGAIVQRLEHENGAVRLLALHVLRIVEPASLSSHVGAIVQRLEDEDVVVRQTALKVLRFVEPASLSSHVGAIEQRLEDENGAVRLLALDVLCIVEPASLSSPVGAIVQRLEDENGAVRRAALDVLRMVEPASLSSHVGAIVQRLEDENGDVRSAALDVLLMVEPASLSARVEEIVRRLEDENGAVSRLVVVQASLSSHVGAIVQRLEDENGDVRAAALHVLRMVEPALLPAHVGAIVQRLEDENGDVRRAALHVLRMGEPALLPAIVQRLEDENGDVRRAALHVLRFVEPASLSAHVGTIVQLLEDKNGAVRRAAFEILDRCSNHDDFAKLLSKVTKDGMTPAHVAACHGRVEVLHYLMKHGADVTAKRHRGLLKSTITPLELARKGKHEPFEQCLEKWLQDSPGERRAMVQQLAHERLRLTVEAARNRKDILEGALNRYKEDALIVTLHEPLEQGAEALCELFSTQTQLAVTSRAQEPHLLKELSQTQLQLLQAVQATMDAFNKDDAREAQQDENNALLDLVQRSISLGDDVKSLVSLEAAQAHIDGLKKLERRLKNNRFALMVYGVYSTGKSALLATGYSGIKNYLPVSEKECTALLVKIDVLPSSDTTITNPMAKLHIDWSAVCNSSMELEALPEQVSAHIREKSETRDPMQLELDQMLSWASFSKDGPAVVLSQIVDHIELTVHTKEACQPYVIIDSPGLGGNERIRRRIDECIQHCDVPIIVATFKTYELEQYREAMDLMKSQGHTPLVVITMMDEKYTAQSLDTVESSPEQAKTTVQEYFVELGAVKANVLFVSALWYQQGSHLSGAHVFTVKAALSNMGVQVPADEAEARAELRQLSGIPALWKAVDALIHKGAGQRRARIMCMELASHLASLLSHLNDQQSLLHGAARPQETDKKWQEDVKKAEQGVADNLKMAEMSIRTRCEQAISCVQDSFRQDLGLLLHDVEQKLGKGKSDSGERSEYNALRAKLDVRLKELVAAGVDSVNRELCEAICSSSEQLMAASGCIAELLEEHFKGSWHSLSAKGEASDPAIKLSHRVDAPDKPRLAPIKRAFSAFGGALMKDFLGTLKRAVDAGNILACIPDPFQWILRLIVGIGYTISIPSWKAWEAFGKEKQRVPEQEWIRQCKERKQTWVRDYVKQLREQIEAACVQVQSSMKTELDAWLSGLKSAANTPEADLEEKLNDLAEATRKGRARLADLVRLHDRRSNAQPNAGALLPAEHPELLAACVRRLNADANRLPKELKKKLHLPEAGDAVLEISVDVALVKSQDQRIKNYDFLCRALNHVFTQGDDTGAPGASQTDAGRGLSHAFMQDDDAGAPGASHTEADPRQTAALSEQAPRGPRAAEVARHTLLARLCAMIYEPELHDGDKLWLNSADDIRYDECVVVLKFHPSGDGSLKKPQWALFCTCGRVDGDFVALVFKGTQAASEWLVDLACMTRDVDNAPGLKLHLGFSTNLQQELNSIKRALDELRNEDRKLPRFLSGHSLGGAYAMCTFLTLPEPPRSSWEKVVVFGAPLVVDKESEGVEVITDVKWGAGGRFLTYVSGYDVVPRVLYRPNNEGLYKQVSGIAALFKVSLPSESKAQKALPNFAPIGSFRKLPGAEVTDPKHVLPVPEDAPLDAHVSDHHILYSYVRNLEDAMSEAHTADLCQRAPAAAIASPEVSPNIPEAGQGGLQPDALQAPMSTPPPTNENVTPSVVAHLNLDQLERSLFGENFTEGLLIRINRLDEILGQTRGKLLERVQALGEAFYQLGARLNQIEESLFGKTNADSILARIKNLELQHFTETSGSVPERIAALEKALHELLEGAPPQTP